MKNCSSSGVLRSARRRFRCALSAGQLVFRLTRVYLSYGLQGFCLANQTCAKVSEEVSTYPYVSNVLDRDESRGAATCSAVLSHCVNVRSCRCAFSGQCLVLLACCSCVLTLMPAIQDDYAEWSGECVYVSAISSTIFQLACALQCPTADVSMVAFLVIVSWIYVLFTHRASQASNGFTKIFL